MLGANPYASNGSLATAPDWPGRLEAMQARGGRLVVVDPRRSRTAEEADEHVSIRPGTDAFLLVAMVHTLFDEGLVDLGAARPDRQRARRGRRLAQAFTPEAVAPVTGIDADTIRRLAPELAAAPTACVYGRIGTTTQEFGTLTSWLVDVLNVCTGNLDRPGGAMFSTPAAAVAATPAARLARDAAFALGRRTSRVRGLPETLGELPVGRAGRGDRHARRGPDPGARHHRRQPGAVDAERRRTARRGARVARLHGVRRHLRQRDHPPRRRDPARARPAAKAHYDVALLQLALRNVANYSPPVVALDPTSPTSGRSWPSSRCSFQGMGADADPSVVDDLAIRGLVDSAVARRDRPAPRARSRRDPRRARAEARPRAAARLHAPHRSVRRGLRRRIRTGSSLDVLVANPHGVDLGALEPRLPDVLRTPSGMIELAPEPLVADLARLGPRARPVGSPATAGHGSCSSAGGTCARTTRGCTTSRSW